MNIADATTFDRVYREHRQTVFHAALRITKDAPQADDVVHDVFVRLWRRPDRFDASRGELASYLRLMARSRALDLWRERQAAGRAHDRLTAVVERADTATADDPATAAVIDERAVTVRAALRELPEAQREAVVLAYWGGLTAEEISHRVDVPLGTVKSRIRLGLAKLRGLIADTLPEPEFA